MNSRIDVPCILSFQGIFTISKNLTEDVVRRTQTQKEMFQSLLGTCRDCISPQEDLPHWSLGAILGLYMEAVRSRARLKIYVGHVFV